MIKMKEQKFERVVEYKEDRDWTILGFGLIALAVGIIGLVIVWGIKGFVEFITFLTSLFSISFGIIILGSFFFEGRKVYWRKLK